MRYLSVCSGIESATAAWHTLGWHPVAFSEIEPFPCALLAHHYPNTPNWGDMTKFKEWPDANVDLLVGGTPCQSFSVAGLRKGLDDPRGNLMLTYLAIAGRYRPKWVVWENVPGVLSSNEGKDFGAFLGGLAELGYGFAYRVLDAQYFGVAQRRRRVFVVGCFGDWRAAAAVLFERASLSGDIAPSRETRQSFAPAIAPSLRAQSNASLRLDSDAYIASPYQEISHCLNAGGMGRIDYETESFIVHSADTTPTLTSNGDAHSGFRDEHALVACVTGDITHTLRAEGFDASEDGTGHGTPIVPVAFAQNSRDEVRLMNGDGGIVGALSAEPGMKQTCYIHQPDMQVRRLTPVECERLQGFPDGYANIKFKGKPVGDGHRYKALGNSKAVPVVRWIGKRIEAVNTLS